MIPNPEYWSCVIGPTTRAELPLNGADGPMRDAVKDIFSKMLPDKEFSIWSGWGVSTKAKELITILISGYLTNKECDEIKKFIKQMQDSRTSDVPESTRSL